MKIKELAFKILYLQEEVSYIQSKIEPQDCGHLKTTVSVLKERINELKLELQKAKE